MQLVEITWISVENYWNSIKRIESKIKWNRKLFTQKKNNRICSMYRWFADGLGTSMSLCGSDVIENSNWKSLQTQFEFNYLAHTHFASKMTTATINSTPNKVNKRFVVSLWPSHNERYKRVKPNQLLERHYNYMKLWLRNVNMMKKQLHWNEWLSFGCKELTSWLNKAVKEH